MREVEYLIVGVGTAGHELDRRGLPVYNSETMQCGNSSVFMSGDATGDLPIWHEAYAEGRIAGDNALAYPETFYHPCLEEVMKEALHKVQYQLAAL